MPHSLCGEGLSFLHTLPVSGSCSKAWLAWQVLTTRARKDVKVADIKVQVCLYAFDCLYLNGQVLVDQPLLARREALYSAIEEKPGELFYATAKVRTHHHNGLLGWAGLWFPRYTPRQPHT